ncbi:MAG: TonB-dependent receptor plug domain-containing protein [Fibromonadaceae bacterium]|nr:TonB-dependent receptor plug domain-containing protein [Fibromonadaceae bacterium]
MPTALSLIITFFGLVNDPDFANADSLNIEVVESGANVAARFNKQFKLELPKDTVWNVCVQATLNSQLEKCYELKYLGQDSVFSAEISGNESVTWFGDGTAQIDDGKLGPSNNEYNENAADADSTAQSITEQVTELRKVVVQLRKKPKRKLGESVVSAKNIKRMPGLAEADVMRSIQALPGVVASSDFSTKIYVRGGASDQNLFLLDNGVVYSPTHFFGLFSTFLVEAVDDVKFYKSGFPAEYGNRLSSVAAINSRHGGNDTLNEWFSKNSVKISTFATQVHTEGHQGNARWVLAARSTYIKQILDFLKAVGATDFSVDYKFTDIQGVFDYKVNEDLDLRLSLYTGADILSFSPLFVEWGNTAVPFNWQWRLNDKWKWHGGLSYSEFHQDFKVEDLFGMQNGVSMFASRQALAYSGIDKHALAFGYDTEFSKISFVQNVEMSGQKIEDKPQTFHHILYAQDTWRPDSWEVQYGLRLNYHRLSGHFGAEPRFAASWEFAEEQKLEFHTGYYLQYLNSLMFSDQEALNEFYYPARKTAINGVVKPSSSILSAIGYSKSNIFKMFNFNAETYYKTQNNLTLYDESGLDSISDKIKSLGDLIVKGEGYSFGYELSLQKPEGFVSGSINWNQGVSVFKDGPNKAYFPNWHQPFALKGDLSFNWFEERYFLRSSFQLKLASGMPYTPYLGYLAEYGIDAAFPGYGIMTPLGNRNVTMQTPYFRLDAKIIDWGKKDKWNFGFTILNLTDNQNLFFITYNTRQNPPEERKIYQFPFFPLLMNWEYYF